MSDTQHIENQIEVTIPRTDAGAESTFLVERTKPLMILDLLLSIQRQHDPSLGFRYSCRVAVCNICGVQVDGKPVLACEESLKSECNQVRIAPLEGKTVLRDLVVEVDHLVDEWERDNA